MGSLFESYVLQFQRWGRYQCLDLVIVANAFGKDKPDVNSSID